MFLLDKPYISNFLKQTLKEEGFPVVSTETASEIGLYEGTNLISEEEAAVRIRDDVRPRIYMTSENAIDWAARHLRETEIPRKIQLFKNKAEFRRLTQKVFPDFRYIEVPFGELRNFRCSGFPLPFIVKPAVGFFSMGVHQVSSCREWPGAGEELVNILHSNLREFVRISI